MKEERVCPNLMQRNEEAALFLPFQMLLCSLQLSATVTSLYPYLEI